MSDDEELMGKIARVTARISAGHCGEVLVSVRQGTETYFAYAAIRGGEYDVGETVTIVDEAPGRTVYVS